MKKIIVAAVAACGLFFAGASLLVIAKKDSENNSPRLVVDYGPYCDDSTYLDVGNTDAPPKPQPIAEEEIPRSEKPLGPEEEFLTINDGETLHSILRPLGVPEQEIALLSDSLKPYLRARDLAAKDQYRYHLTKIDDTNRVIDQFVIRKIDPHRIPIVYRASRSSDGPQRFEISVKAPPVTEKVELVEVTVGQTLYQTFNQIPFGTELMQRLMAVFTWTMRMPADVTQSDQIEILALKRYIYGDFIGFGKIVTAVYRQKNRTMVAIYFASSDGKIQGFFDENGKSLEREFAVSPVYETTATSNQKFRLHPVRKIRMRHNGIDYRGSIGTEFYSIADGEVIEKRYDVNVGNMIRVLHKYGVHSEYFHADSLADNVHVGGRVKRGQLLGTIGRTGRLCTGPHLHMGLYTMRGDTKKFIELSSLRTILKSAPDINGAYVTEFLQHQKTMLAQIDHGKNAVLATSGAASSLDATTQR